MSARARERHLKRIGGLAAYIVGRCGLALPTIRWRIRRDPRCKGRHVLAYCLRAGSYATVAVRSSTIPLSGLRANRGRRSRRRRLAGGEARASGSARDWTESARAWLQSSPLGRVCVHELLHACVPLLYDVNEESHGETYRKRCAIVASWLNLPYPRDQAEGGTWPIAPEWWCGSIGGTICRDGKLTAEEVLRTEAVQRRHEEAGHA